jgi:DNA-binding transcriptional LysR family regulator
MDLIDALRCFIRVVETGSFSAVSRESRISQSAVSRQVAQLEEHFRARLFHRSTRRLILTDDGQSLLAHARRLMDVAEEMEGAPGDHTRAGARAKMQL